MKTIITCLFLLIFSAVTNGQDLTSNLMDEVKVTPPRFTQIEQLIQQEVVSEDIYSYLLKNISVPESTSKFIREGVEVVQFVVTPEGNLTDFNVISSVSYDIDDEVIRVLRTTDGAWRPGTNDGTPVAMEHEISLAFKASFSGEGVSNRNFKEIAEVYFKKGSKKLFVQKKAKRALHCFDNGVLYRPNDQSLLLLRGLCRYELDDKDGAIKDWDRMKILGSNIDIGMLAEDIKNLKGYPELISMINK